VARAYALLGDGRRAAIPLAGVPAAVASDRRAGALLVTGRVAIRRLVALDGRGARVASVTLALPPPTRACNDSTIDFGGIHFPLAPRGFAGPARLTVADEGSDLCVSLGDLDRDRDCAPPPVRTRASTLGVRRVGGSSLVAGAVPRAVAALELEVGGRPVRIETQPDAPGYGGQYREQVRFFAATLPGEPTGALVTLRSAAGERIGTVPLLHKTPPVTLPGSRPPVGVARLSFFPTALTCLESPNVGQIIPIFTPCAPIDPRGMVAIASCSPRAMTLYLQASARVRGFEARLGDGRRLRSRARRVASGPLARTRVLTIDVPAGATVRSVRAGRRAARLDLVPAARQCGYSTFERLTLPGRANGERPRPV
jgi:hypothetical protein